MGKKIFFSAVLSLFLLVPASITWGQTITQQKGLTTAVFTTANGRVTVYLPDDIRPGDMISGKVIIEPDGKNPRQTERNLEELKKLSIRFGSEKFLLDKPLPKLDFIVPVDRPVTGPMELFDGSGNKKLQQLTIPSQPPEEKPVPKECQIPSHALTGAPLRIPGPFDGDLSTTRATLGNKPIDVLAESPRQSFVYYPAEGGGIQTLEVQEAGKPPCSRPVSGVDMAVGAGKLDLQRGERTYVEVEITGLRNLPDIATLTLNNLSSGVVNMFPSNTIVIPLPPDSVGTGTFKRRFDIQSLRTGSFNVNINLDLPEVYANANPDDVVPPGYIRKTCECGARVTLTKTGTSGNNVSFKASSQTSCSGQYGIGIQTFPRCTMRSSTFVWTLGAGSSANAELNGKPGDSSMTIRKKTSGNFVVCVKVTVVCVDGTTCEATACADQDGNLVDGPGTEVRPPFTNPPPVPTDPTRPPTATERKKCKCICSASATAAKTGTKDDIMSFKVDVKADCKLEPCPPGATVVACGVTGITYNWAVTAGGGAVAIQGAANGPTVALKILGKGAYVLTVTGTVTCSDGTTCPYIAVIEDWVGPPMTCNFLWEEKADPAMDGGLLDKYRATNKKIKRDDFIPLGAEGRDFDILKWICEPKRPDCEDTKSEKAVSLNGRVRFEWTVAPGKGGFVKLGCLPNNNTDAGEHVIFMPPVVPLPVDTDENSVTTEITLLVIDDNPTQPLDATMTRNITIVTKRKKNDPDYYYVDIIKKEPYRLPQAPPDQFTDGTCKATGVEWTKIDKLATPAIQLPTVPDNDKMVLGQWIVLTTDVRDIDNAKYYCVSQRKCPTGDNTKDYEDNVAFTWTKVGGGSFISDPSGRTIIFQAPLEMAAGENVLTVTIKVKASNPGASPRKDKDSDEGQIVLRIYRPGVKLSHPPLTWLPEENNSAELTSELMYKNGNNWLPSLAHMCRIHFFELKEVSTEKGVCMNAPEKEANLCRDLQLKNEAGQEAFIDTAKNCKQKEFYMQARTEAPVISYTIKVYSNDFGSFGFLRSFANISKGGKDSIKGQKPEYISIPVKRGEVTHPQRRPKKTEYRDNRVTIPMDIDENHIADNGWTTAGGIRLPDPENQADDTDGAPAGDGTEGDGISNYEEYRGFKVRGDAGASPHTRINHRVKDIFINNVNDMPVTLYAAVSGLDVHSIRPDQYSDKRVINFNYTTSATHVVDQMGLKLVDLDKTNGLLGIAHSVFCPNNNPRCNAGRPAPPNWMREVRIYSGKIGDVCTNRNLNRADKLAAVVAHELLHANNVCHHGESEGDPEDAGSKHDNMQGTRSGNVSCVMRYDNIGTTVDQNCRQVSGDDVVPEAIGNSLCGSPAGTGYNASTFREERRGGQVVRVEEQKCFGNAATNRGNCIHQIRVSGRGWRAAAPADNAPATCGGRGL